jgi:hypothetical protein
MKHTYTCPGCGRTVATDAGWRARGKGQPCRPCVRVRNGWTCKGCGTTDPEHATPCSAAGGGQ